MFLGLLFQVLFEVELILVLAQDAVAAAGRGLLMQRATWQQQAEDCR